MKKFLSFILIIISSISLIGMTSCNNEENPTEEDLFNWPVNNDTLYLNAVIDAVVAEPNEILPLVNLVPEEPLATIRDGKVLLVTFHHYPDSYIKGTTNENIDYLMWTFTEKEIIKWYKENKEGVNDWHLRFCQLVGVPASSTHSHFSAVWAKLEDVIRPAYETDVTKPMRNSFTKEEEETKVDYINWFNGQYVYSYSSDTLAWRNPWTRLGYTYDWADNDKEYGLSEFLIARGSDVEVEFTYSVDEFVQYLEESSI